MALVGREAERARLQALARRRPGRAQRRAAAARRRRGSARPRCCAGRSRRPTASGVLRARGMESESDIPFAGLAELVSPLLGLLDDIPAVQASALRGALALGPAAPARSLHRPRRRCSRCSRGRPRSGRCWRSSTTRSGSTRRRSRRSCSPAAGSAPRAWPCSARCATARRRDDAGAVAGAAARARRSATTTPRALLGARGRARAWPSGCVATAAGNPLALLEIPRLLSAAQLAGREPLEEPLRPGTERRARVRGRGRGAARAARGGRCSSRRRPTRGGWTRSAAGRAGGLSPADLEPAEAAGSSSLAGGELEFRHPLLRSTVYHAATPAGAARRARRAGRGGAGGQRGSAPGTSPPARSRPTRRSPPPWSAPPRTPAARGAHAHRGARPAARRPAHARRRAARAARCSPRPRTRSAAARSTARQGMLDEAAALHDDPLLTADVERLRGHVEMRRGVAAAPPTSGSCARPSACARATRGGPRGCSSRRRWRT